MGRIIKIIMLIGATGFIFWLRSAEICAGGCSITVPCPTGGVCYCEVKNVNSAVCEGIKCTGNRTGCKAYGYCFLIPKSFVCCCPYEEPLGSWEVGNPVKFEKIFKIKEKVIEINFEKDAFLQNLDYNFFYGFKDPKENLFVGVSPAQHKIFLSLNSKEFLKENVYFWIKYIADKKLLFYSIKKDSILEIHKFNLNTLEDNFLTSIYEDPLPLSSLFSVTFNKMVLKNKNNIEIFDISGKKLKDFLFKIPSNIVKKYSWQNEGWFLGSTENYIYVFFNSLPYVIVLDTSFNFVRAYDFYEDGEIEKILFKMHKEIQEIKEERGECAGSYSISECFTIPPDKVMWIFGNSCFVFENGKFSKKIIFKCSLGEEKIDIVPFSIFEISDGLIFLNFSNLGFSIIKKEEL
jgi:hypothetical protein